MKIKSLTYLLVLGTALFLTSHLLVSSAQTPNQLRMATGSERGNYYAIGTDIKTLAQEKGNLTLEVVPTEGALANLSLLLQEKTVSLALSQRDVLAFLNTVRETGEFFNFSPEDLQLVLPLYSETVHLLVGSEIQTLADLNQKKVAIGEEGSGTNLTAVILLQQADVIPADLLTLETPQAISALRKGEIDAVFYVIGPPAPLLSTEISPADKLKLLPLTFKFLPGDEFLSEIYEPFTLAANTYPWQSQPIQTLAVQSGIFTSTQTNCEAIAPVARLIYDNLGWLQANGSSLWKKVDFGKLAQEEPLSPCVTRELAKTAALSGKK
ncbi:MAG: TAXI family TRAP transporter solute-binding subunit [Chloroflexaceae bacterium]|nr:TAXI family TRAP transporter solute-binding subunit [Chloroflexaceae bacterium]